MDLVYFFVVGGVCFVCLVCFVFLFEILFVVIVFSFPQWISVIKILYYLGKQNDVKGFAFTSVKDEDDACTLLNYLAISPPQPPQRL